MRGSCLEKEFACNVLLMLKTLAVVGIFGEAALALGDFNRRRH